jgi:nucleoid-associated protein YgaU
MGLIDFVASAGEKLFGAGETAAVPATEPAVQSKRATALEAKIARAHYGDANRYGAIFEANRPMLKDPDRIHPGQLLRIPPLT